MDFREQVRVRYHFCCGYCGTHETEVGALLTIDHFHPTTLGGTNLLENLVYCCDACNRYKADFWHASPRRRLLHPLRDQREDHIVEEAITARWVGITTRGQFHIERLHLNRPVLVQKRYEKQREYFREMDQHLLTIRLERVLSQLEQL
jgi:HNH endonuclease